MDHFYESIQGSFTFEDFYRWLVKELPPNARTVEVGTDEGRSAAFLGVELKNAGRGGTVDLVDLFQLHSVDKVRETLAPVADVITFRPGWSNQVAATYEDASLDAVFIDAGHDAESVRTDIQAWLPKVKPGGIIGGHDFALDLPGVIEAVIEVFPEWNVWRGSKYLNGRYYPSWWVRVPGKVAEKANAPEKDPSVIYDKGFFDSYMQIGADDYASIADVLHRELAFGTVLDIGCGPGLILERLQSLGHNVMGVEGSSFAIEKVPAGLRSKVLQLDITAWEPAEDGGETDLVICSEVAEHLDEKHADHLVHVITTAAKDAVFFTAATPGQGGHDHVNEQPREYWIKKFEAAGFHYDETKTEAVRVALARAVRTLHWFPNNAMIFRRFDASLRRTADVIAASLLPGEVIPDNVMIVPVPSPEDVETIMSKGWHPSVPRTLWLRDRDPETRNLTVFEKDVPKEHPGTDVAVIIPCFKQAVFLREAVGSVLGQTRPPKELVVVVGDDESLRAATNILGSIGVVFTQLGVSIACRILSDPGFGLAHARNIGIAATKCPLIFPLDADDKIEPTCLEEMVAQVEDDRTIVASWIKEFGESQGVLNVTEEMLARGYTSLMCLFTRKLWELTGGYCVASPTEDWGFWLDCHKHQATLKLVKKHLVRRRMHPAQMTKADPYDAFIATTKYLRPWFFERTEANDSLIRSMQPWIERRLEHFPDSASLKSLLRVAPGGLCLAMIVKNESKVIERCLSSVRPLLSYWIVVDTGSTDGTQDIVRRTLAGVPGELHESTWKDFSTNRNEALELATGKMPFVLVIDADDILELAADVKLPELVDDAYRIRVDHGDIQHSRAHVFRPEKWRYQGVIHEGLYPAPGVEVAKVADAALPGIVMKIVGGGGRSQDPRKFVHDARVLKEALVKEPGNARYAFYLAQSWRDAWRCSKNVDHAERALKAYLKRAKMGGFPEEVFLSLLEAANLHATLGHERPVVERAYLAAYESRPFRAEPLFHLARWLRCQHAAYARAALFARHASMLPKPPGERLFVEDAIYDWWAMDEFAVAASWIPELRPECALVCGVLLERAPVQERDRIRGMLAQVRNLMAA